MMNRLAHKLAQLATTSDDYAVGEDSYAYGFEVLLGKILTYALLLIVGILFSSLLEITVFSIFFVILRERTGGYHLKNSYVCIASSVILGVVVTEFAKRAATEIPPALVIITLCLSVVYILLNAPINHPNLDLSILEAMKCKKLSRIVIAVELLSILLLIVFHAEPSAILSGCMAIFIVAVSMKIAKSTKQEVPYRE